jgi:hypothetical protein
VEFLIFSIYHKNFLILRKKESMNTVLEIKNNILSLISRIDNQNVLTEVYAYMNDRFTENLFWDTLALLDWENEDICAPAVVYLSKRPELIVDFDKMLSRKLYELDGKIFAEAVYGKDMPISVDDFLYVRCFQVAQGKEFYKSVLENPALMKDDVCESLLSIGAKAYQLATQKTDYVFPLTEFHYETYSNAKAWGRKKENIYSQLAQKELV